MNNSNENYVTIEEATKFIENNLEGKITKKELDVQRNHERNSVDMMIT